MPSLRATRTPRDSRDLLFAAAPTAAHSRPPQRKTHPAAEARPGTPLELTTTFTLARGRVRASTLRRAVLRLPSNLAINAADSRPARPRRSTRQQQLPRVPARLEARHRRRPLDVPAAGLLDVPGQVTLFNGPGGRCDHDPRLPDEPGRHQRRVQRSAGEDQRQIRLHADDDRAGGAAGPARAGLRAGRSSASRLARRDRERPRLHRAEAVPEQRPDGDRRRLRLRQRGLEPPRQALGSDRSCRP